MFCRDINTKKEIQLKWIDFDLYYFGFSEKFQVKCLNSLIVAKAGNISVTTIRDILIEYWKKENTAVHYFIFQIIYKILKENSSKYDVSIHKSDIHPHIIMQYINLPFTNELWNKCISNCFAHKLTYIKDIKKDSLADFIINKKTDNFN